ncbi:MAG: YicC family protein [Paracoccaceae bacterium]|nr:YicC family protein [Paracoccaceae bacterium]
MVNIMIKSMTGFASGRGAHKGWSWNWDLRAVNGRGLELRLRVPDWLEGLEQRLRAELQKAISRGNVTLNLRLNREAAVGELELDMATLDQVLAALRRIETTADGNHMLKLAPTSAAEILSLPTLSNASLSDAERTALVKALLADVKPVIQGFDDMRIAEGSALADVISEQLDQVESLVEAAKSAAESRKEQQAARLAENLAKVLENAESIDPTRVAQELAMIAVKTDVTEEMDRLTAHVSAARELLEQDAPIGRKFDFLTQEFNREANTLCSKAQSTELTRIGLDLKAVIDQMREQVQNVE